MITIKRATSATRLIAMFVLLCLQGYAYAATYTLPDDAGSKPFKDCSVSGNTITCSSDIDLKKDDVIEFSQNNLIWEIDGDLNIKGDDVTINSTNASNITINVDGNFTSNKDELFVYANLNTTGNIELSDDVTWQGNLTADGNIELGENSDIAGDITAGGFVDLDDDANLTGNITAGGDIDIGDNANINGDLTAGGAINIRSGNVNGNCQSGTNSGNYNTYCSGAASPPIDISPQYCESFDSEIPSYWTVSGSGSAGISTNANLYSSPAGSMFLQGGQPIVTSHDLDLSSYLEVDLSLWVKRGSDAYDPDSEDPDPGEDLNIEFFDSTSNWVVINSFLGDGSPGEEFNPTYRLPSSAIHANFAMRFRQTNGSSGNWDYWHVDDVCLTPIVNIPNPVLEYRFDEDSWDGTSGEVIDSSATAAHATADAASSTTTTNDAVMCNAASLNGVDQFIESPGLSPLRTTSTLSFWIKTPNGYTGTSSPWSTPVVTGYEEAGGGDDIFWGYFDENGKISTTKGNTRTGSSNKNATINDNNYHHVVSSWDSVSGEAKIYIDGVLDHSYTTETGDVTYIFKWIGLVEDSGGSLVFLNAQIDEFVVFDEVLTPEQVAKVNDLQSNFQNLDGSPRTCEPPKPSVCFTDNFDRADLGSDWAVSNRNGSFGDPRIEAGRLRLTDTSGSVATAATLFRLFPSAGNRMVMEFDYFAYGDPSNGGDGLAFVLSDSAITPQPGGYGGSLGYAPKGSISGFAGGWLGIGLDEYGNFLNRNDGNKNGGFTSRVRETVTIRGSGIGTSGYNYITSNGQTPGSGVVPTGLSPTVENSVGHRYRITVDHENGVNAWVTIERDTGSGFVDIISKFDILAQTGQTAIPEKMYITFTGSTGGARHAHEVDNLEVCANTIEPAYFIDHYELDRDYDQGLTCEPLNIISRACLDANCNTQVSGPVTTTFAPTTGWASSNTKTNYSSGDSFLYQQTTAGTYTLGVTDSTPSLKPLSTEPVKCFVAGAESTDCNVEFVDAAYRFFNPAVSAASTPSYSMTAGEFLNTLLVRAIETNEATGECQAFLSNGSTVTSQLGTTCSNPSTCAAGQQVSWQQSSTVALANPENQVGGSNTTTAGVEFINNSTAQFNLMAPDIGSQVLTITTPDYPDVNGAPSGRSITGSVTLNVSPANLRISSVTNAGGNAPNGTDPFAKAGENFSTTLQALDINGNPVASFGRVSGLHDLLWNNTTLAGPAGGTLGTVTGDSAGASSANQWQGVDTDGNGSLDGISFVPGNGISYSEVGDINLIAEIDDFMGFGTNLVSNSVSTGRFTPAYLQVTEVNPNTATWGDGNSIYQGQDTSLTGLTYDVVAYDVNGNVLTNYVGSYVDFGTKTDSLEKDTTQTATGGDLTSSLAWTVSNDSDFDGSIRLTGDLTNVNWARNATGPTSADTLQTISDLLLNADAFTDGDGICIQTTAAGSCETTNADIADRSLYFGRLTLPSQVNGTDQDAFIPVSLEYLSGFVGSEPVFSIQSTESDISNSLITGLNYNGGLCTLTGCPASGTNTADLADGSFSGPNGTGTTLVNGLGQLSINSATSLQGMVEANAQIPSWLTWYWDGDTNNNGVLEASELSAASTIILFGQYQGRPPILFTRPGFR